ncbi:hypothetical protein GCM10027076_15890 [Nocardioides montaniterrae]
MAFGSRLRELRGEAGLRQVDLAEALGIGRSTLANVERGHETPSERLWDALLLAHPAWIEHLRSAYEQARADLAARNAETAADGEWATPHSGGPFEIESVAYTYVFEESRSPVEIIEVRKVKALEGGASYFGLQTGHTSSEGFRVDQEALWGGRLTTSKLEEAGHTLYWRRFEFDRPLRIGQRHEFAIRSWVERDPEPGTYVTFRVTIPTKEVRINLAFHGPHRAATAWRFGPLEEYVDLPASDPACQRVRVASHGCSARFLRPELDKDYALGWDWA